MLLPDISMADHLAELLGISKDSVYRRIKGEKQLSFDELATVAAAFNVSLDELFNLSEGHVIFHGQYVNSEDFNLESFLESMLHDVAQIQEFDQKELIYISKDIPVFYYLMFPEIAAFKFFVWTKTQMQFNEMKKMKFSFDILTDERKELCRKICDCQVRIPGAEILNADNILNDLRQLEYYRDTNLFADPADQEIIYNQLDTMISHMEAQASCGKKFHPGLEPDEHSAAIRMYVNDFFVGDNTIIANVNDTRMVYINHSAINYISTASREFAAYNFEFIQNIIRKSSLISEVGERTRNRFFNLIHERIDHSRHQVFSS